MPDRLIREGLVDSKKFNSLNEKAQIFFVRLMLKADDFGVYPNDPELMKSLLYPRSPQMRLTDILHFLHACVEARLLARLTVGETAVVVIVDFRQRLRVKKSRYVPVEMLKRILSDICPTNVLQVSDSCTQPSLLFSSEGKEGCGEKGEVFEDLPATQEEAHIACQEIREKLEKLRKQGKVVKTCNGQKKHS